MVVGSGCYLPPTTGKQIKQIYHNFVIKVPQPIASTAALLEQVTFTLAGNGLCMHILAHQAACEVVTVPLDACLCINRLTGHEQALVDGSSLAETPGTCSNPAPAPRPQKAEPNSQVITEPDLSTWSCARG